MWKFKNFAATETEAAYAELRIEGDIVSDRDVWIYEYFGVTYTEKNEFRSELQKYQNMPITVWIDSFGGDVFAAVGIYNALKEHNGKITVKIDGKAMSAATIIAMAGDEILISPSAIFMVHNPLTDIHGYSYESDLRKAADVLAEVKEAIINVYQLRTGKSRNKISELMDNETYMSAKTAIKEGFADAMLYADEPDKVQPLNLDFNRLAIANSAKQAISFLQKMYQEPPGEPPEDTEAIKAKLALQLLL
jgi:ATP-dependent Clp protease protease subunit